MILVIRGVRGSKGVVTVESYGHFFADTFHKNAKIFTKWVAVARKSLLTAAFCVTRQDTADGDIFGPKSFFCKIQNFVFVFKMFAKKCFGV